MPPLPCPSRAGESPAQAAAAPEADFVGADVKGSSAVCPTGPSLNCGCEYVTKASLMQAAALDGNMTRP